ncbi:hypothetical protein [Microbacterium sp. P01]|uniref:hypothetical protein n=1 Tax=unclassified Microbacterium TaxID=2609290 RepID=UPI00366FFD97
MMLPFDALIVALLSTFLFLALSAALALVIVSLRRPSRVLLIAATGLVVLALIIVAVTPVNVPVAVGLIIALLGTSLAILGGDPVTRQVLTIATHGTVRDGAAGGILLRAPASATEDSNEASVSSHPEVREVMRGGATIGYLERTAVVVAIVAGFPEALAIIVAVKGVGRFSELAAAESRERFIIGTMASLLWASVVGGLVHLAIW